MHSNYFTYFLRPEALSAYRNLESPDDVGYFYYVYQDSLFWVPVQPPPFQEVRRRYQNDSISTFFQNRAVSLARRWANSTSGSFVPHRELSTLYTATGQHELALEAAKTMIRQPPDTVLGHRFFLGWRYLAAGDYESSLAVFDRALELSEQNPPAWDVRIVAANVFMATGQPSRALDDVLSFVPELEPMSFWVPAPGGGIDHSQSWPLLAKAQVLGSSGVATPELVATLDSLTERWAADHTVADLERLYWSQTPGLTAALVLVDADRLQQWLSHFPGSLTESEAVSRQPSAWQAHAYLEKGATGAASAALDSALALQARWPDVAGPSYVMGLVAHRLGRDVEAIELFSRIEDGRTAGMATGINRMSPLWGLLSLSYLHRARAYERLGDLSRAEEFYERFARAWARAEPPARHYLEEAEEGIRRTRSAQSGR